MLFTELPVTGDSSSPEPAAAPAAVVGEGAGFGPSRAEPDEADGAFAGLVEAVEEHLPGDMDAELKADLLGELDARCNAATLLAIL